MKKLTVIVLVIIAMVSAVQAAGEQLLNLPNDRASFPVPSDITWPTSVGDPHICLWYGDKFAATCITIDDNLAYQHTQWMQLAQQYNFTPTWFVITGRVDEGTNPTVYGTWSHWADMFAQGADVQSHSVNHHSDDDTRPDAEVIYEYEHSQQRIDANVTASKCLTFAYPNGKGREDIARDYFIACRGVNGTPNKPGKINWMNTCSASGRIDAAYIDSVLYGTSTISWLNSTQWKRGWVCTHFHGVNDWNALETQLAYVDSKRSEIWFGSFLDVVRFGQERDSAVISMVENTASRIAFTITDRMDDTIFDHPLTIKLRIPDQWNAQAVARQNGNIVASEIKQNGDYDYVLIDAVPDKGLVEISQTGSIPGDLDGDGDVDIFDFLILRSNYGISSGATAAQGDLDGDGAINIIDFLILRTNYGYRS